MHRGIRQGCPIQYNTMRFTTEIKKCGVDHFRIRHNTPTMTYNYIHIKKLHMCRMRKWSTPQKIIFLCENNYISILKCCVNTRLIHNYFHIKTLYFAERTISASDTTLQETGCPIQSPLTTSKGVPGTYSCHPVSPRGVCKKKISASDKTLQE